MPEIMWTQLFNERMTFFLYFEEECNNGKCLFVVWYALFEWSFDKLMDYMNLKIILDAVEPMLWRTVHMHMIDFINIRTSSVKVCKLDTTHLMTFEA